MAYDAVWFLAKGLACLIGELGESLKFGDPEDLVSFLKCLRNVQFQGASGKVQFHYMENDSFGGMYRRGDTQVLFECMASGMPKSVTSDFFFFFFFFLINNNKLN